MTKEERPWGWYDVIDEGDRYKVKSIEVNPGQKLSLQKHHHRAEHWVVVSGTARDGVIESIEHDEHKWCMGIQWHPEFLITQSDKLIIKNFIKATKS